MNFFIRLTWESDNNRRVDIDHKMRLTLKKLNDYTNKLDVWYETAKPSKKRDPKEYSLTNLEKSYFATDETLFDKQERNEELLGHLISLKSDKNFMSSSTLTVHSGCKQISIGNRIVINFASTITLKSDVKNLLKELILIWNPSRGILSSSVFDNRIQSLNIKNSNIGAYTLIDEENYEDAFKSIDNYDGSYLISSDELNDNELRLLNSKL